MKKIIICTLFLLCCIASVYAQNQWFESGSKWYYVVKPGGYPPGNTMTVELNISKDTIVWEKEYKVIKGGFDEKYNVRQEGEKVFWLLKDSIELLIYDFSVVEGDTLSLELPWDWTFDGNDGVDTVITKVGFVIDSVKTISLNNTNLKAYHARSIEGRIEIEYNNRKQNGFIRPFWSVEKVGSFERLVPNIENSLLTAEYRYLSCFSDDSINFMRFDSCVITSNQNYIISDLEINPTLVTNLININVEDKPYSYTIMDAFGKIWKTCKKSNSSSIDTASLRQGFYYILVERKGKLFRGKFVKI